MEKNKGNNKTVAQIDITKNSDIINSVAKKIHEISQKTKEDSGLKERKKLRLEIAQETIKYCFVGLGFIALLLMVIWYVSSAVPAENEEIASLISQIFQFLGASVFSVLTLALGFVAGSSID